MTLSVYICDNYGALRDLMRFALEDDPRVKVVGEAEDAITCVRELPETRPDDIEYFQVLCARADGSEDDADDFPRDLSPRYLTATRLPKIMRLPSGVKKASMSFHSPVVS